MVLDRAVFVQQVGVLVQETTVFIQEPTILNLPLGVGSADLLDVGSARRTRTAVERRFVQHESINKQELRSGIILAARRLLQQCDEPIAKLQL